MQSASWIKVIARAGLIAKGVVYSVLGTLAFMAAFEIGGLSDKEADKQGVFEAVKAEGGEPLLAVLVLGLFCYSIWRIVQAFANTDKNSNQRKSLKRRLRYFFSGIAYGSVGVFAARMLINDKNNSRGSSNRQLAEILDKPWGQWAVGVSALIIAGIGTYQIYYGLFEKYRKHVSKLNLQSNGSGVLLRFGKIGYVARGLVWMILGWLLLKAAIHVNSKEAGNTGKAFQFLENTPYGSYWLGALGLGLLCYGIFNFIRSRYETNF
jgi:hypothetical protein